MAALGVKKPSIDLSGTTLVVGLGKSGLSVLRTLLALGARVRATDSRAEPPGLEQIRSDFPHLPCYVGGFSEPVFADIERIVISPGVALHTPLVQQALARGVPVWGDIELFARLSDTPVAAITGSNGKSTVTALLGLMAQSAGLEVAVGGNLGTPVLDLLQQKRPDLDLYVLELSSFQLETTASLTPKVAALLNISPDHMDRYASLDDYIAAKQRIFRGAGHKVVNADDPVVAALVGLTDSGETNPKVTAFTCGEPGADRFGLRSRNGELWLAYGAQDWVGAAQLKLIGQHNLANVLAALAMGQALGLDRAAMCAAARAFPGLPHRSQWVAESGGVGWFNDSKGTNVGATVAAIQGLPGPVVLIAGGDGKGQDFSPLRAALKDKVRAVVTIGRDGPAIAGVVKDISPVHCASSLQQAVELAAQLATPGDSVLLSPACASFDMFKNYEERGDVFAAAARGMAQC